MKKLSLVLLCAVSFTFAQSPVPPGAKVDTVRKGFQFVEGPVWSDSLGLLFSDIYPGKIYRWRPDSGLTVFLQHSDSSNGLTFDRQGRLILTQMELRRVSRMEANGTITPLATSFRGKHFNSPNDVVVKSSGTIFFTDPNFNIPAGGHQEQPYCGIYCITASGNVRLVDSTVTQPNGICFSPDESKLYVDNSVNSMSSHSSVIMWDVLDDSTIGNKRQFSSVSLPGYADGMKVDSSGNLFCCAQLGVWVFSPGGTVLDTILVPSGSASNCNWGDGDRKTLYITSGTGVYKIRLGPVTGVQEHGSLLPQRFELLQNFPNPFNPSTTIRYRLGNSPSARRTTLHVNLSVYDALGEMVASLVNGDQLPGEYVYPFPPAGSRLASGTYFYRLTADGESQTRSMLLLK